MEVSVKGSPKEIAELVLEIQARQKKATKPKGNGFTVDGRSIMTAVEAAQRRALRIGDIPDCSCKPGSQ